MSTVERPQKRSERPIFSCPWSSWITAQEDGTEHAVTDDAQVAGMTMGHGSYEAVCGAIFLAACMDVGPLRRCPRCRSFLRAQAELRDWPERIGDRRGRRSWLCRRRRSA